MKTLLLFSLVAVGILCSATVEAQKSRNETLNPAKIITYNTDGTVKIIIDKEKVDRFYSIPVDEDYLSWYEMCSQYDWPTVRFILLAYQCNEININSRADVERIAYTFQKMMGTLYDSDVNTHEETGSKASFATDIK
ncbi:MAG: hypothetical protein JXB49_03525 [Bacteroidales bacterium]|nr:hypothetical protein [Bacteroidales bacterium]